MFGMGHRYTESDFHVGLTRTEAKAKGLTRKRQGTLRMYFDGKVLMEAYSYNTCIIARMAPSEDFPYGRLIVNESDYGPTSKNHLRTALSHVDIGHIAYNPRQKTHTYEDGSTFTYDAYDYLRVDNFDYTHRAILIDVRMGRSADDLRDAVTCMQTRATWERTMMRERRIARIARIKEYNRTVNEYNQLHNHANVLLFARGTR